MKVFFYWDRPAAMPAYLKLCLATWFSHFDMTQVVVLTDENMETWLPAGTLDQQSLGEYPLAQQKDAIEVAILARYGGLFMDADTICLGRPTPLIHALESHEIALYGYHLATLACRPGSTLMQRWLELVQEALEIPREKHIAAHKGSFHQLGNSTFELLREELVSGRTAAALPKPSARPLLILKKARRRLLLETTHRHYIKRLSPRSSGYTPEIRYFKGRKISPREKYQNFWFSKEIPVDAALLTDTRLIALHHSWTPEAYSSQSVQELLQDQSLLSRLLQRQAAAADLTQVDTMFRAAASGLRSNPPGANI